MKKSLIDVTKRSMKKSMIAIVYVLLVALLSVGIIGCSKEETTSAKTSVSADAKKSSTKKTEEGKNADDTRSEDETEESKEEVKETTKATASESTTKTTASSSAKKSSSSNASTTTKKETSTNSSSSSKLETTTEKEEAATHTHSWEPVYKEVDKGYWKQELVKAAWTEEIPQYTMKYRSICNGCGADITDCLHEHMQSQMLAGNFACGGYTNTPIKTQIGTKTVEHPAEYKDVWVSNIVKEVDYYKCSCGATK